MPKLSINFKPYPERGHRIRPMLWLILLPMFFFVISTVVAEKSKLEKLEKKLKSLPEDTNKVLKLDALIPLLYNEGDYNKAMIYALLQKNLAENLNFKRGIASSHANIGVIFFYTSEYNKALEHYLTALRLCEELGDKKRVSNLLLNIGSVYYQQGKHLNAIDFYSRALTKQVELKDSSGMASAMLGIGNIFWQEALYSKALDQYFKALKIQEVLGHKNDIAYSLSNIGLIYQNQKKLDPAEKYFSEALKIQEENKDKNGIATSLSYIGINYNLKGEVLKAKNYFSKALKIQEEIGDKEGMANTLIEIGNSEKEGASSMEFQIYQRALKIFDEIGNREGVSKSLNYIGEYYLKEKNYKEALNYENKSLTIANEIGVIDIVKQDEEGLSKILEQLQQYDLALMHFKKYILLKDSIESKESALKIEREMMKDEFSRKEQEEKIMQDKKDEEKRDEERNTRMLIYFISGILIIVLTFAFYAYRAYLQKKKANRQLDIQNKKIETAYKIIEEKNQEITHSINYAKRIQQAMLPEREEIYKVLPQSFVFFKPKDIVSGDFYFFATHNGNIFIAAADCTGHGVPGAFMSMIGSEKLTDAVMKSSDTSEILKLLDKGIKSSLHQSNSETSTRDGMDIALVNLKIKHEESSTLYYSGANRPLWIIRKGQTSIEEIKASKIAIGGFSDDSQYFSSHEIKLYKGDSFYLFSDGFADQFGGAKGKKLTSRKFKELLLEIQNQSMQEQEKQLELFADSWKGEHHQVDDLLVIGVRV